MGDAEVKKLIHDEIVRLLNKMNALFLDGELAYIMLQQKNERPIRDKLAYHLQLFLDSLDCDTYDSKYLVKCEWPNLPVDNYLQFDSDPQLKQNKVDIAILKMNENKTDYESVLALIELKDHQFLNEESWPQDEFKKDMAKMVRFTNLNRTQVQNSSDTSRIANADLYFIIGVGSITQRDDDKQFNKYASAIGYKYQLDFYLKDSKNKQSAILYKEKAPKEYRDALKKFADKFRLNEKGMPADEAKERDTKLSITKTLPLGTSFGYRIYLSFVISGPYKASNINISEIGQNYNKRSKKMKENEKS